jgi:hypothetical protein
VEAMRTRMSLSEAIQSNSQHLGCDPLPRLRGKVGEKGFSAFEISPHPTGFAGRPPPQAGEAKKLSKRLGETLDHAL